VVTARDLTPDERKLLLRVLGDVPFDGASELQRQVDHATVVGGIPTLLELRVDESVPVAKREDGPIPVRALVEGTDDEIEGEVLVWVKDGYLSGLELAWFTDDPPTKMPTADSIRT
jgi:hypothetical protein